MITKMEAFSFLKEHQPMPSDKELTKEEMRKYDEVRDFFINNPDEQCIPLWLNSFGGKDGFGIYQMVEDVIRMYDKKAVLPHILKAFNSPYEGVKYWCIQISSNFPDESLFNPLISFLRLEDEDIKTATIIALAQLASSNINVSEVIKALKEEIERISDEEIKEFAIEVLADIQDSSNCKRNS